MSTAPRRILISCLVIAITACICLSFLSIAVAGFLLIRPDTRVAIPVDEPTPSLIPTPHSSPAQGQPQIFTPGPTVSSAVARQMDEIQDQVIEIRGLQSTEPVDRQLLTTDQLRQHVIDDFLKDYTDEEAHNDVIELSLIGLLEPGYDLKNILLELYAEQIAGYYDDEAKVMYVIQGEGFEGPERLTYSHEYVHALQDQHYNLRDGLGYNDEDCEKDTERCAGIQALLEGDATTVEFDWLTDYATPQDYLQIQAFYSNYQSPVMDSTPGYLQEDFTFPYTYGADFVKYLIDKGGWEAVDQAFLDPPLSTEQIIHPDHYPDDKPINVDLPDLTSVLGSGWREISRNTLGEWYTYLVLAFGLDESARLSENRAIDAAQGWGGDTYLVYDNDSDQTHVLVLKTEWDSTREAEEFAGSFVQYATDRFGKVVTHENRLYLWESQEGAALFQQDTRQTIWILAPKEDLARAIFEYIQNL
jgi:hypothetical protein